MKHWFIEITNKEDDTKITIYKDGAVYGKERGKKYGILTSYAMDELSYIINESLGDFRKLRYYDYKHNPFVLKINDINRHNTYKIIGWPQVKDILRVLCNKSNFDKLF